MAPPAEADAPVPHETGLAPAAAAAPVAAEPKKPARRPGGGKPVTLIGWLRSNGGVKDDGGELRSRDLGKRFIGLVNSRGMSLDDARLRAAEAGYFGPMKDRQMAETTVSDLLDLIDQHPTYSSDDQEALDRIADKDAQKRAERRHEKDLARARLEIRGELGRHDLHPDEEAIDLAARLMVEDGQAWDEAFERATMRLAHETPETKAALDATATEDGYDAIPWDDYLESPPAQEAAAGATGGRDQAAGGSRQEGDRGGEEGADQRRPQEPARAGEDAQDQAPRDEGKRSEPDQDAEVEPTDAEKPEPKITVEDAVRITKARAKGDALLGQHIGEYTAVGTRESPWGTERGFGETALEAQHDARRRLGMKDWKAIGAEAFKKGENRIPPRGLAGYPYESTLWTRGWDQANIAEPVPGVDMPGRPAADPDDDLQSRIAAAERLQIADLVKRGTTGHVSPFLLADGSIIAPNIEHREFASENDRATTGMIRFNFYKENIEGRPILNIDLVSGQKFTDRQRKAFERMASANLGAQVGIDVTALNGDHIADATGIARDGFISAADSLGIIGDAAKETEPQAGSLIEREKWNDGRWKAIAGDEVYQIVPGFGGSAARINGKVYGTKGKLRVEITGSVAMLGNYNGPKTVLYDHAWTVKDDPRPGDLYARQGAGWPVDVIVIDGKGQSARAPLTAEPPPLLTTWGEVKEKLNGQSSPRPDGETPGASGLRGEEAGVSDPAGAGGAKAPASGGGGGPAAGRKPAPARAPERPTGSVGAEPDRGQPAPVRRVDVGAGTQPAPGPVRDGARADFVPDPDRGRPVAANAAGQAPYRPASTKAKGLGTLIPANLAAPVADSLDAVQRQHGQIDHYVADALGYDIDTEGPYFIGDDGKKARPFSAEQIDALGLALDNVEKGAGFIVGDQTGIGKGRVVAGAIRHAHKRGMLPVFVTEKPDLYGDMWRDLHDIGWDKGLGRPIEMFMTNAGVRVPLDERAVQWVAEAQAAIDAGDKPPPREGAFSTSQTTDSAARMMHEIRAGTRTPDVVFTTYDQMNSVAGQETDRREFLRAIAPRAFLIMDEAHNAGGQGEEGRGKKDAAPPRSKVFREAVGKAKAVLYSSATYAKSPKVMDLFARTDMAKAVDDPAKLGELIATGGVPMQQIVAAMLSRAGQYVRRERSFEGVSYEVETLPVDAAAYEAFTDGLGAIFQHDRLFSDERRQIADKIAAQHGAGVGTDGGTGDRAASTTEFSSIMHNAISQMVLSIKAKGAAERAIQALRDGERPVIALSATMESFLRDFTESAGVKDGDPINLDFGDVLRRYLERTRRVTIKMPDDPKRHFVIPLADMSPLARQSYEQAKAMLDAIDMSELPISPIDAIRHEIQKAGYSVREVTGRSSMIDYSGAEPRYVLRPAAEQGSAGKRVTIRMLNNGDVDAVILNRSGSTGVSMHAGERFKNQQKRRMILVQADPNIDVHLQMLGRVHRTGQVALPAYSQLAADIPAEVRPTAVLMKKMASLNANTTAARKSAFTGEAVDFMNKYGDLVATRAMLDDPETNARLGFPVSLEADGEDGIRGAMAKVTGRLTLLRPADQQALIDTLTDNYVALIERLDAEGINDLEAKAFDLQAKVLDSTIINPARGPSPFEAEVRLEQVSVKATGRSMTPDEVLGAVLDRLDMPRPADASFAKSLPVVQREARARQATLVSAITAEAKAYADKEVAALKQPEAKARARKKHDDNIARWQAIANLAAPGQIISIRFQGADMPAVVLDFASKTKPGKNPVALSAWHLAVAVPDSARTIGAPLSQIFTPQFQAKSDKEGLTISPASYTYTPATLAGAFEQARKEGRDVRWMFAGNILAAYDQTNGGGQIITHTMEDGSSRAAILMPKAFKRNDFMANRPIRFAKAQQVMQFLDRLPDGEVATTDEVVMIRKSRGSYEFDLPAARASGGRYYADAVVRAVFDGWIKKGSRMRADLSAPKAVDMIGAMMKVGAVFETRDHQDIAQAIVDGKAARPQMAQTAPEGWTHVEGIPDRHGAELARMVNQVADIFDTVLPREVGYEITREIRLHADNARDAIERSGGDHRAPNITGLYSSGMKMVRVATFAPDAANTAYHEAWHAAQDLGLATARELAVLRSPAELKRMRAFVASSKGERTAANMPPVEIEAYTFGAYASALNKGREPPRLHSVTNGVFARLYELLRRLRNFFAGRGFQTVEDIIGRFQRGDMAKRPAAERTGSRLHGEEIMTARERAEAASGRYFAETAGGPEEGADRRYFGDRSLRQKVEHRISKLPDRLDIKEGILDMHARVQATQQEIAGGGNIPSQHDVYKAKRRLPGQLAAAQQDFRKDLLEPLFDTAKKAKLSRQDIAEWLYAKHAPERNAAMDQIDPRNEGRGSGITDDEAQAIVDRLTREGKAGALENVARHVADIRDFILERSVETGLMSQKNADELSTRYEAYVPLQGWDDPTQAPENARELRPGGGLRVKGPEHRQAFGRKTIPADPLSTLINNAMRTIDRAEKNKALRVAWRFLRTIPADELSGVRLDKGRLEKAINPETGLVYYKEEAAWRHRDNVVPLKIGGVPHYIVFDDPVIAKAWMRMSAEQLHWTLAWAGRVVNVAKSAWTHWNPEFVARHFGMRYPIEGALNAAEHGGKAALGSFKSYPMGPAYRAIRAYHGLDAAARADLARRAQDPNATQHDKYLAAFHEMREQGGLMSWADFGGVDRIRAKIDRALLTLDKNPVKASIGYMRAAHEAIDLVTSAMDNAQRLVAYMQARERGLNKIDAALEAREATVDFAVKGVWANYLTLMWPFANTAAQTASRMARAARRNPRQMLGKVIGGMFSFGMAAALYAYLFGGNDEDGTPFIEKTGDWTRRLHVVVPIPGAKDEKKRPYMLQISLPYNYAMPFVAGQTVIALMMRAEGRSKQDVGKILGNLTHSVLEGTTPLAQEHSLVGKMTPELMRPFLHVAMNQNWHGAPVHPSDEPWNKGIPASEKGFRSTAEMWKRLARVAHQTTGLDYHPEDYREVMSYFTSTLQGVASRAGDAASDVRSGRKPDPTDVPVAHAFIGGGKQYDSADRRAYYEARDKAFAAETRFKDLKKAAQIDPSKAELVQDFYEKHQADIRAARLFRSGTGTLSDLTKQMNRIQQNKDMTPTEQETELRALRERQLSTMNRLRERVRAGGE